MAVDREMLQVFKKLYFKDSGYAWLLPSWPIDGEADSMENSAISKLQIFEDGKPLGPAHAIHEDIRLQGAGMFSHWKISHLNKNIVTFSTSDNSNPNTNGRKYDFVFDHGCDDFNGSIYKNRKCISEFLSACYARFHYDDFHIISHSSENVCFFICHLMRVLRSNIPWGSSERFVGVNISEWPVFSDILHEEPAVLCGTLARLLGDCAMGMGFQARSVLFPNHMAVEIEVSPGRWVYFDPAFQFSAMVGGKFLSAKELIDRMDLIENWDNNFNYTFPCLNLLLNHFKLGFCEGENMNNI